MPKPRAITCALDDDERRELYIQARHRHIGGRFPEAAFFKYAAFAWMKKYPVEGAERERLEKRYEDEQAGAAAAQPELVGKE